MLYVEDNPADVLLVRTALSNFTPHVELSIAVDGEDAMEYLWHHGKYQDEVLPQLILLDLNLPRRGGEEVLLQIKTDPKLRAVPVVIFTSAASELICKPLYQEYANTCIRKPSTFPGFLDSIQQTCRYWFSIACLPGAE